MQTKYNFNMHCQNRQHRLLSWQFFAIGSYPGPRPWSFSSPSQSSTKESGNVDSIFLFVRCLCLMLLLLSHAFVLWISLHFRVIENNISSPSSLVFFRPSAMHGQASSILLLLCLSSVVSILWLRTVFCSWSCLGSTTPQLLDAIAFCGSYPDFSHLPLPDPTYTSYMSIHSWPLHCKASSSLGHS